MYRADAVEENLEEHGGGDISVGECVGQILIELWKKFWNSKESVP